MPQNASHGEVAISTTQLPDELLSNSYPVHSYYDPMLNGEFSVSEMGITADFTGLAGVFGH